MAIAAIIDSLFCLPKDLRVTQISDCVPFSQDLAPQMDAGGIGGAVLAPCNCEECQHEWNCADRKTHEIVGAVARDRKRLWGLASYDPLRIGESLRWIDEAITKCGLVGAYAQAECCGSGLDASRMYPMYGLCARLGLPAVLDFRNHERWLHHRPQVEVVAADFPELNILLAPPPETETSSILQLMLRFPRISLLLCPQELQTDTELCEYVELEGRERVLFRSSPLGWAAAVETATVLPLGPTARRAYLFENARRLFRFPADVSGLNV